MIPKGINGRGEWIRTTDLLVPNQAVSANSLITEQIFLCKTSINAPKIRQWVGSWVGSFPPEPISWCPHRRSDPCPARPGYWS